MRKIVNCTPLENYQLRLEFDDSVTGIVDIGRHVGKGVFALWNDPKAFKSVTIAEHGELAWSDQIDLCTDALYLEVTGKKPEELFPALA